LGGGKLLQPGCGNLHYDNDIRVPLSSIDQRSEEIGNRAAKLILDILANELPPYRDIILQPRLIARDSTARNPPRAVASRRSRGARTNAADV
jgi:LacI family transcriptional regulator